MSELRTLKRGRGGPRIRSIQGRLFPWDEGEEAAGAATDGAKPTALAHPGPAAAAPPPRNAPPPAYRSVVAGWPEDWRERWGRRANELEEGGLSWRDAESQAFVEVWSQLRRDPQALAVAGTDPERN